MGLPRKETESAPKFGIGILELLAQLFEDHFKFRAKYPIKVVIPIAPKRLSLFWASQFGELPQAIRVVLEKHYREPLEIETVAFKPDQLVKVMDPATLFPRRICQDHLTLNIPRRHDAYAFFLDASNVEDVVDFWNLRAMGRQVLPIPKQLQEHPQLRELLNGFLKAYRRPWDHDPTVCDTATILRARSRTMEEVQAFASTIKIDRPPNDSSKDGFFRLQHWYPRIWDAWARDKDGGAADLYGEAEESVDDLKERELRVKPVWPSFARKRVIHAEARCANEIRFRVYGAAEPIAEAWPRTAGRNLSRVISGRLSLGNEWRIGRNGLVKLVGHSFAEGRDIPLAEDVFFAWLTDLGWKPALSSSGLLAKQIYKQLEGYAEITLRNERLLGLLEHMSGGQVNQDGSPADQHRISQERPVAVGEVKTRLKGPRTDLTRRLVSQGVFALGLRVVCPNCFRKSWFSLKDIAELIACPRCLSQFAGAGNLESGTWCYKAAGPFSVPNYAEGAYLVLLTRAFFNDRTLHTMRTTPALSFKAEAPGRRELEADLGLLWAEEPFGEHRNGVLFAECKTYGEFRRVDFQRMEYFAQTFPGAVLVFSTLRQRLGREEVRQISRIAKAGRKYWKAERPLNPVLVLTGRELLNWQGPPDCWDGLPIRQHVDHVRGLLHLCDLTQQVHLGLPSWETVWHEVAEETRAMGRKEAWPDMSEADMERRSLPLLFLLGPSGVGKSTLCAWVAQDLGFLHLEIDRFPEGDGIDLEGLRGEWNAFWLRSDGHPLAGVLMVRGHSGGHPGVLVSFPSGVVPSAEHINAAGEAGIRLLVLYGTEAECREAFLRRERESGRGLGVDHWIQNNAQSYAAFSEPLFAPHRISAFGSGSFRSRTELVRELKKRAD